MTTCAAVPYDGARVSGTADSGAARWLRDRLDLKQHMVSGCQLVLLRGCVRNNIGCFVNPNS